MRAKLLFVMLLIVSTLSHAGFVLETTDSSKTPKNFEIIGMSPVQKSNVGGIGRDMTLQSSLEQIVPHQYAIVVQYGGDKKVSWKGGSDWTDIVADLANQSGTSIAIDTDKNTITVRQSNETKDAGSKEPQPVWEVKAGTSLRETIGQWANKAGWQFYWDMPGDYEYTFLADASFTGSIENAVESLVTSVSHEGYALKARFYDGNHLLRITGNSLPVVNGK